MNVRRLAVVAAAVVGLAGVGTGIGVVAGLRSEVVQLREQMNRQPQIVYVTPPPAPPPPPQTALRDFNDDSGELDELRDQIEDLEQERDQPAPQPAPRIVQPQYEPLQPSKPLFDWEEERKEQQLREQEQRIEELERCQRYGGISCY